MSACLRHANPVILTAIVSAILLSAALSAGRPQWSPAANQVLPETTGPVAHDPDSWYPHRLVKSPPRRFDGPFRLDGSAFYFVHFGGPLRVTLTVGHNIEDPSRHSRIAVLYRFYDADDVLVDYGYYKFGDAAPIEKTFQLTIDDGHPGIYQLRCSITHHLDMYLDVETEPDASFGILPCRAGLHAAEENQFEEAYIYVPPGAERFAWKLYAGAAKLYDGNGKLLMESEGVDTSEFEPAQTDVVYRLSTRLWRSRSNIGTAGFPAILCPDEQTARNIRASIEFAPDGRMLYHKLQLRYWRWMHALHPAELAVEPVPLTKYRRQWLQDPTNLGLLSRPGPLKHVPFILHHQNIDPESDEYGKGVNAGYLAAAYAVDHPANPYAKNEAILNRLLLYEFATFLDLNENGTFYLPDWDTYCGGDGLFYVAIPFKFGYIAPMLDDNIRNIWLQGVAMPLHRWAFSRVSCENQTSSFMPGLYHLYRGSDRDMYRQLAHDFAIDLCDPRYNTFMKTGYQQEKYGPDSTYQGLCASNQAAYYQFSKDPVVKRGLDRVYNLFNLTVAPEPDGSVYGASNFCHRTSGSWVDRQWKGGTTLMADDLDTAAAWHQDMRDWPTVAESWKQRIDDVLTQQWDADWYEDNLRWVNRYPFMPWTNFFDIYLFPPRDIPQAQLPVAARQSFTRNANDEFYFVRRPRYYAFAYVGHTSHEWMKPKRKQVPYHSGWIKEGDLLTAESTSARKNAWYPTQGLCMFWTPDYGNCILGKNWNVYTAQMVRADLADGNCSWPDYWSTNSDWDPAANQLAISHRMIELPIALSRNITFNETGVQQSVQLSFEADVRVQKLVEQIPYLEKPDQTVLFEHDGEWSAGIAGPSRAVWIGDPDGAGVGLLFDQPADVQHGIRSESRGHRVGLLEVSLGSHFASGHHLALRYRIQAAARADLPALP